ncbi:hypothetical protein OAT18_03530 [Tenacibaculum sp.]|nr:hypothetical protein [Tenacibaculum sp.]
MSKSKTARRIKSYKLGYRWGLITADDKQMLGNLIEEILRHSNDSKLVKAFLEGESHARDEKPLVKRSLEHDEAQQERMENLIEITKEKDEEQQINEEVVKLREIRESKEPQKDQSKGR